MFIQHCSFCLKSIGAFLITAVDTFAATKEMQIWWTYDQRRKRCWRASSGHDLQDPHQMKFRNMLSAHTRNRADAPLWPNGNLANCFRSQRVYGGINGHLHIPHSFETRRCGNWWTCGILKP